MDFNNENIQEIKKQIKQTESEIDNLTNTIKDMEGDKIRITENYEAKKEEYETFKSDYAYQSTYGLYFLIVTGVVFFVVFIQFLSNSIDDFFMWPATILFILAIVGKVIGSKRFKSMKPEMTAKETAYKDAKKEYKEFMSDYNSKEKQLEEQQLKWELVENDMIEARKDAWIKEQRKLKANA